MQTKMKLNGGNWGGLRMKAGRKRFRSRGVAHQRREKVSMRTPLHINFKYRTHIRNKETLKLLKRSLQNARSHGLKIHHYAFQSNHVHLIVEARNNTILTKSMRSLTITFAKGLNKGRIQIERYHLHVLRSIQETKHALQYVLFNQPLHEKGVSSIISEYSSLLSLKNGLEIIQRFAVKKKMTLSISSGEKWCSDSVQSFLLMRALSSL